jgi:uncharacterized protein YdeI (YjbR/CyaY-like superfamily)
MQKLAKYSKKKEFKPFKQREFAEYVGSAKRENTKQKRLEKIMPLILKNVGLNDKYKK